MEYITINGGKRLEGSVQINGAKNAAVAIIPAAIASAGVCIIDNLPNIRDVQVLVGALQNLGIQCEFINDHTLKIDSRDISGCSITYDQVKDMRASYYLLGALLGRFKHAEVPLPGGCNFGVRPIDLHMKGFEALGAKINIKHGVVVATADKLTGADIYLDISSVGATINIMIAAVYAEGVTQIENAAKEPHVVDTANFLNKLGAKIKGAGTDIIRITGVKSLHGGEYSVIPDQIETGTYMIASAITGGDVTVKNVIPKHMDSLSAKLTEIGCKVEVNGDSIRVVGSADLKSCNVKTMFYPGFPTDLHPQMAALLCTAKGTSVMTEAVFEHRFQYVKGLLRLGANIKVEGRAAIIEGGGPLTGAQVTATDLRAGASLIVAGLAAQGQTIIGNLKYLDRGYERFEEKLAALGADINRIEVPEE
ncbi:MAG: UDP-N-acetylglucosamine 1-carboxyvinyltransferase [Defluviitaleaceae bacterium]|nr:UDP-N-acetylglucosamine 1-carboxyvinyltransferase [Defluviitaleaceae bacterium]